MSFPLPCAILFEISRQSPTLQHRQPHRGPLSCPRQASDELSKESLKGDGGGAAVTVGSGSVLTFGPGGPGIPGRPCSPRSP